MASAYRDCRVYQDRLVDYEALSIPAAAADGRTAEMGNGEDLYEHGVISAVNSLAAAKGVKLCQPAREAARMMLD